jgi:Tfp pilus assembly protein PilF
MLGIVYFDRDELDAAHAALAQAVLYLPKDARGHHYLGVTFGRKGWHSAAEDELRKAVALDPDHREAHYNLAVIYLQRTPPAIELARRHYEKAVDLGGARDPELEKRLAVEAK